MGWARTLLLGDIGNRLDIADAEDRIRGLDRDQREVGRDLRAKELEIDRLRDELGRQKLAIRALTRFLIEKGIIGSSELEDFVAEVDAEDGVVDGRMELDPETRRLRFTQSKKIPEGVFRKAEG